MLTDEIPIEDVRTRVYTDLFASYNGLGALDYNHIPVNHAIGWGHGHFTTNHIENFWGVVKD